MPFHNILNKAESAVRAHLIAQNAGTSDDVFAWKRATDNPKPPFTAIIASDFDEEQPYSSQFKVEVMVEIHTNAAPDRGEDTETMVLDSDERVQATGDALSMQNTGASDGSGLADEITSASPDSNFSCQSARMTGGKRGRGEKQGEWIEIFIVEMLCMPSGSGS